MAYASAYRHIYAALIAALKRNGVYVGNGAECPRVELHSFNEQQSLDKGGSVRVVSCTMESMSAKSPDEVVKLNEDNLRCLASTSITGDVFAVVGIVPTQLTDLTEVSDSKPILYRLLQTLDIYIQQL